MTPPDRRFVLDPYGEFGPNEGDANDRSDVEKLHLLADWFDRKDDGACIPDEDRQIQADLRRIATVLERQGLLFLCASCGNPIHERGALLFGPPDERDQVVKTHLCVACYAELVHREGLL